MLEDVLESPAFWLLGGGAVIATVLGYIMSKRMEWIPMPLWQLIVMIIVELVAAAIFASGE